MIYIAAISSDEVVAEEMDIRGTVCMLGSRKHIPFLAAKKQGVAVEAHVKSSPLNFV
jgi:hypothetical protein